MRAPSNRNLSPSGLDVTSRALEEAFLVLTIKIATEMVIPEIEKPRPARQANPRRGGTEAAPHRNARTTFARTGYLRRALEAGASGYLLNDMQAEELADTGRRTVRNDLSESHSASWNQQPRRSGENCEKQSWL